jgi:hypothetical protein
MAAGTNYLSVWRPGSGTQWWVTGWSYDDFKAKDLEYFNQGLRLTCLRVRNGRYTAVWHPGGGTQWWVSGWSYDDFKAKDLEYFNQGLRLVDIEVSEGTFTAVWRPGSGAQWWVSGWNYDDFKAQDLTYFNQGLRLQCLRVHDGKYTAVWRPGTGTQWWVSGYTFADFKAQDKTYFDQGLRLTDIEIHAGSFTGVWRPGTGAQWWRFGDDLEMMTSRDRDHFDNGLRLVKLFPYTGGCDAGCLNQVLMPAGTYNYGITRTAEHCPGLPGTCGTPGPGEVVAYRWPNVDAGGAQRRVRLSALDSSDQIFTLPFTDTAVKRRGPWLYAPNSWHQAIDYSRDDGATFRVVAAAPGRVIFIGWDAWSGNTIVMSHNVGRAADVYRTIYMHLRDGPAHDCAQAWSSTVPTLGEPRLSHYKTFLASTGCPLRGRRNPQAKYWGSDSEAIDTALLGTTVARGAALAWAGETGPGGCGCTDDASSYVWGGGTNVHLHIFFAARDTTNNEWYLIDPYGIYGPPDCYPATYADPIGACARYPVTWLGGKPQFP